MQTEHVNSVCLMLKSYFALQNPGKGTMHGLFGAGLAQWLDQGICDRNVSGSNPGHG